MWPKKLNLNPKLNKSKKEMNNVKLLYFIDINCFQLSLTEKNFNQSITKRSVNKKSKFCLIRPFKILIKKYKKRRKKLNKITMKLQLMNSFQGIILVIMITNRYINKS